MQESHPTQDVPQERWVSDPNEPTLREQISLLRSEFSDYREYTNEVVNKIGAQINNLEKIMVNRVGF